MIRTSRAIALATAALIAVATALVSSPSAHAETTPVTSTGSPVLPPPGYYSVLLNDVPVSNAYQQITDLSDGGINIPFPTSATGSTTATLWLLSMFDPSGTDVAVPIPPGPKGKLRLGVNQQVSGIASTLVFKPGTVVSVNLGPAQAGATMSSLWYAQNLGTGSFDGIIPPTTSNGKAILEYKGVLTDGTPLTIVVGVIVRGENATIITYPKVKVSFSPGSARLTSKTKSALSAYLATADREHPLSAIVKANYSGGGKALAKQRAAKVQTYLENNGITGGVMVQTQQSGPKGGNIVAAQLAVSE